MSVVKNVDVGFGVEIANNKPFALIAGSCVIESLDHALFMAGALKKICDNIGIKLIYKSSFDKANRSSVESHRGISMEEGLGILAEIRSAYDIPVVTDVHEPWQCEVVAEVVDMLQIPAFLCRQTDLLLAAGNTGKTINVKKGQFLAPWDMVNVADKLASTGNEKILLCDRGTSFGYNTLVTDIRGYPIMAKTGYPVVCDATHSVQQPGGNGKSSGGQREFVPVIARAAVANGVGAVFMECHENPEVAMSDGPNSVYLKDVERVLSVLKQIDVIAKANPIEI